MIQFLEDFNVGKLVLAIIIIMLVYNLIKERIHDKKLHRLYVQLSLEYQKGNTIGICAAILDMNLDGDQFFELDRHVQFNRPSECMHPEFFDRSKQRSAFWWDKSDRQTRIQFINKMIDITK